MHDTVQYMHSIPQAADMKAVFGKTIGGISSITRGTYNVLTSRFRRSETVEQGEAGEGVGAERELSTINGVSTAAGLHTPPDCSFSSSSTSPSLRRHPTSLPQEDDILYRKNNVYLKCRIGSASPPEATPTNSGSNLSSSSAAVRSLRGLQSTSLTAPDQQKEEKVPGFLFIASRGANYGSTLILNWAPNSSIIKCSDSINSSAVRTEGEASSDLATSGGSERTSNNEAHKEMPQLTSDFSNLGHQPSTTSSTSTSSSSSFSPSVPTPIAATQAEPECVSIDLGEMEIIRIFYHTDETGCKVSGEMVVSSRQTDIWVFKFQNGGLTDLIHLFCSWDYFNHQEHR